MLSDGGEKVSRTREMSIDEENKLEFTEGELIFRTDIKGKPKWMTVPYFSALGALMGLLIWAGYDRVISLSHILGWVGGAALLTTLFKLSPFCKKELKEIRIDAEGFKIVRVASEQKYKWEELEAARFQDYRVHRFYTDVHCFIFRINGKNKEIILDGIKDKERKILYVAMERILSEYEIPPVCAAMPSFEHTLGLVGAIMFVAGAAGIIIAYMLVYKTLGLIFGGSVMATGTVISLIMIRERVSKWILAFSIVIVAVLILTIQVFDIDVGNVFREWEKEERQLGRPPWTEPTQTDSNDQETGSLVENLTE